jgi:hypothetical protein
MPEQNFKTRLKKLSLKEKLVFAGSGLLVISAFLPWYKDIDRFNTGDLFLGVSGPVYLAGVIVLLANAFIFGIIMSKLMNKKRPKFPLEDREIYIAGGAITLLMLILANSVYFHPKFGINLTAKTMGIGMILAFISVGAVILGAVLYISKKEVDFESEGTLDPLIDLEEREAVSIKEPINEPEIEAESEESEADLEERLKQNPLIRDIVNEPDIKKEDNLF